MQMRPYMAPQQKTKCHQDTADAIQRSSTSIHLMLLYVLLQNKEGTQHSTDGCSTTQPPRVAVQHLMQLRPQDGETARQQDTCHAMLLCMVLANQLPACAEFGTWQAVTSSN